MAKETDFAHVIKWNILTLGEYPGLLSMVLRVLIRGRHNFCVPKDTTKTMKRQPKNEKISADQMGDKGLISRLYEELLQFSNTKSNKSMKKMGKGLG